MSSRGAASLIASTSTATFRPSRRYLTNLSKHASSSRTTLARMPEVLSSTSRRRMTSTSTSLRPSADPSVLDSEPIAPNNSESSSSRRLFPSRDVKRELSHRPNLTTPQSAQKFLTDLLALPSDRQFSPHLSIQIVTHKSYRWTNAPNGGPSQGYQHDHSTSSRLLNLGGSSPQPPSEGVADEAWFAASNSRLQFLGRRAMATYLPLFIHSALRSGNMRLQDLDFLGEMTLHQRIDDIRDSAALGRSIGSEWGVFGVMRWDGNHNALKSGAARIKGSVVEAILGAVFSEFGSPAAQRLFHSRMLPLLLDSRQRQIKDPYLREKANDLKEQIELECRGGFLYPAEGTIKRHTFQGRGMDDVGASGHSHVPDLELDVESLPSAEMEEAERKFATA